MIMVIIACRDTVNSIAFNIRVFAIFIGAIFNQAYLVLIFIAVVMNIETIRRVIICRDVPPK